MDSTQLKETWNSIRGEYSRYIPVVVMAVVLLSSSILAGIAYTQPLDESDSGSVSSQSDNETDLDELLVVSAGSSTYGYDLDENEIVYELSDHDGIHDQKSDGSVIFVRDSGSIRAVQPLNDNTLWESDLSGSSESFDVQYDPREDRVIAGNNGGFHVFDAEDGSELYLDDSVDMNPSAVGFSDNYYAYSYIEDETHRLKIINKEFEEQSDFEISSTDPFSLRSQILINEEEDIVIAETESPSSGNNEYVAYDIDNESELWTFNVENQYGTGTEMQFNESQGAIISDGGDGLFSLYSNNGSVKWSNSRESQGVEPTTENRIYTGAEQDDIDTYYSNGTYIESNFLASAFVDKLTVGQAFSVDDPEPETEFDPELEIDTRNYLKHNQTSPYTVEYTNPDNGTVQDISSSDDLSVNSSNESVFTIDEEETEVVATDDESINQREQFTAEYNDLETQENVTVANATVENLEILPGITRAEAVYTDSNIILILVGTMLGVVATRGANSFAGLGAVELTLIAGWFVDLVSLGVVFVGLFTALFIGLNMAANIDYTVRR